MKNIVCPSCGKVIIGEITKFVYEAWCRSPEMNNIQLANKLKISPQLLCYHQNILKMAGYAKYNEITGKLKVIPGVE